VALSALTRTSITGATVAVAAVVLLAGCSNSGSATAPAPITTAAPTSSVVSPAPVPPGPGVAATPGPGVAATPGPGVAATGLPRGTSEAPNPAPASPSPRSSGSGPAGPGQSLPLDTKLYPPPEVPRSAGSTPSKAAYLQALQKGGLTVTASGTTELTLGKAVCDELAKGSNPDTMRKLLVPVGALAASLGKSSLTGDQVADLYFASAKANLC
jgi:hypothetical protein